jgi:hypothetical protein
MYSSGIYNFSNAVLVILPTSLALAFSYMYKKKQSHRLKAKMSL